MNRKYIVILTMLLSVLTVVGCSQTTTTSDDIESYIAVEVAQPTVGTLQQATRFSGRITADNSVTVTANISLPETVKRVNVNVGDRVSADQILVELADTQINDQVQTLKAQYDLALASYNSQVESYQNAVASFKRIDALYRQGAASKSEYDQAKLAASNNNLALLKEQLDQAKLAYNQQVSNLSDLTLKSPVDGTVADITFVKDNLATSQNYIRIVDQNDLKILFNIPENLLDQIALEQAVQLQFPALDTLASGVISAISPSKVNNSNMYQGTVSFDESSPTLKPDMTAYVIASQADGQTLLLTIDAVLSDDNGYYVYIVDEMKQALKQSVEIGYDNGEQIEILSGLTSEDQVIVKGQNFITDTTNIKVIGGE